MDHTEKLVHGVLYCNEAQFISNGPIGNGTILNYHFQDAVFEFNTTAMAPTIYQLDSSILSQGNIHPTANGLFRVFTYTYTTVSQETSGSGYIWGTCGYSGNLVFEFIGESPMKPKTNMSAVAIDQINATISFSI